MTTVSTPLSERLRTETKAAHTAAERSGVMQELLGGTITVHAYAALLANLFAIYVALERELTRHADHPALRVLDWSLLRRQGAIQQDLDQLAADGQQRTIATATHEYVARLSLLGAQSPALLFAHAYLRYLGDLYGGQIIRAILAKRGAPLGSAVAFYEFEQIGDVSAFKAEFRRAIDCIPLTPSEADRMVTEVQLGYELHQRLFEELAR